MKFYDSYNYYKNIKISGNSQFFITKPDQLTILNDQQQEKLVQDIQTRLDSDNKIVHSVYILSNLDKPWQRKMLLQQYDISKQIKANIFVFHLQESPVQYDHLDTLIRQKQLVIDDSKCQFALENTSKRLKDPQAYMNQIKKYKNKGMTGILDIAHVASSGLFNLINKDQFKDTSFNSLNQKLNRQQSYNWHQHEKTIKQVIQFVKKYGKNFQALHLADQIHLERGQDIHTLPFSQGTLFTFANMFTSIDLLDELLNQYNIVVLEFVDQSSLFRNAVIRYLKQELYINPDLISYYVRILRWYETGIQGDESFRLINYEAIAQQLIEITRQPQTKKLQMNSPIWKQYCIPHKVSQLLLIVELTSYFLINKIKQPWEQTIYPPIKHYDPEEDVVTRKQATAYINKLIKIKLIKSDKQVFGSYLRGNKLIGDLDILIDKQDKDKAIKILQKHVKNLKSQTLTPQTRSQTVTNVSSNNLSNNKIQVQQSFNQQLNDQYQACGINTKQPHLGCKVKNNIQNTKQQDKQLKLQNNPDIQILETNAQIHVISGNLTLNEQPVSEQLLGIGKQINTEEDLKYEAEYTIIRLLLDDMIQIDIYFASKHNPAMELFLTGNKYFNIYMRRRAGQLGYKLTNTQLFTVNTYNEWIPILVKKQSDIFKRLNLPVIAPKFRVFYNC